MAREYFNSDEAIFLNHPNYLFLSNLNAIFHETVTGCIASCLKFGQFLLPIGEADVQDKQYRDDENA